MKWPRTIEAVDPFATNVFLFVVLIWRHEGRVTVRDIADEIGCSTSTVHQRLHELRDRGLVAFENGSTGTLRPAVGIVCPPVHRKETTA